MLASKTSSSPSDACPCCARLLLLLLLLLLLRLLLLLLLWQLERPFRRGGVCAEAAIVDQLGHERAERGVHAVGGGEEDSLG